MREPDKGREQNLRFQRKHVAALSDEEQSRADKSREKMPQSPRASRPNDCKQSHGEKETHCAGSQGQRHEHADGGEPCRMTEKGWRHHQRTKQRQENRKRLGRDRQPADRKHTICGDRGGQQEVEITAFVERKRRARERLRQKQREENDHHEIDPEDQAAREPEADMPQPDCQRYAGKRRQRQNERGSDRDPNAIGAETSPDREPDFVREQPEKTTRRNEVHAACPVNSRNTSSSDEPARPERARSSSSVPSAWRRPARMMPMRSATRSATSRMCVVMMTVAPSFTRSCRRSFTWRATAASSPVSGSSRISSFGS